MPSTESYPNLPYQPDRVGTTSTTEYTQMPTTITRFRFPLYKPLLTSGQQRLRHLQVEDGKNYLRGLRSNKTDLLKATKPRAIQAAKALTYLRAANT